MTSAPTPRNERFPLPSIEAAWPFTDDDEKEHNATSIITTDGIGFEEVEELVRVPFCFELNQKGRALSRTCCNVV
ncbi:hypothetical protein RJT34_29722 [Clitoria ternatea]|uniref:Uncharacterized protein n=1 Tax=Clitoria ternatea TaxID=43366 RepID=A0AAN9ERS4_CLITE